MSPATSLDLAIAQQLRTDGSLPLQIKGHQHRLASRAVALGHYRIAGQVSRGGAGLVRACFRDLLVVARALTMAPVQDGPMRGRTAESCASPSTFAMTDGRPWAWASAEDLLRAARPASDGLVGAQTLTS